MNQETNSKHRGGAVSKRPYGIQLPNLRDWRMYRNLTQTKLAELAGTTLPTVNGIESRAKSTSFSTVGRLSTALSISVDDLRYELPPRPQPQRVQTPESPREAVWVNAVKGRTFQVETIEGAKGDLPKYAKAKSWPVEIVEEQQRWNRRKP